MSRSFEKSVQAVRADIIYEELLAHPEQWERAEDVPLMPRFAYWDRRIVESVIADLVAEGVLTEAADGALCLRLRSEAA